MPTFDDIRPEEIRYDCRHYTGYRPCRRAESCVGCEAYDPRGTRILIIKLGAMGDVLRTTCLLPILRREFTPCHITWITAPESRELLAGNPAIDRLLTLRIEDVLALEIEHFDYAFNFDKDAEALALAVRVNARVRRGFAPQPRAGTLSIFNEASLHALRLGLSDELKFRKSTLTYPQIICEMAELPYRGEEYVLELDAGARRRAGERFEAWRQDHRVESPYYIGLNTGCGTGFPTKQWTVDGFSGLARELLERDERTVCLLLGGTREREFNDAIVRAVAHPRLIDTGCDNSLRDFMALLERCDAVVSSDSLAMHVAIALRRPVVALFGPTCHQEVDLFGRGEKIVTDFPCSPCYLKLCPHTPTCMESMTWQSVLAALERMRR